MKNTILVTGAAGFIGFHISLKMAQRGDRVIGFDNFNDYYDPQLKKERAKVLKDQGVEIIHGDLCDKKALKAAFEKEKWSCLLHLAAQAGVRYAKKNPEAYLKSNLEGFLNILELLKEKPFIKLVYASSSSVYGCNTKIPFSIDDQTDKPANLYAATKKANELMAYSYHHLYNLSCIGLRFFTVYGPWGRPDMAYYSFTEAILEEKPIHLFNQGKMQRDFTYVDDVVNGILSAIDLPISWDIFNLGNHQPQELLTFISILENELGKKAKIILEGESKGEVEITYADIDHSRKVLNYAPQTSLEEGLSQFVKWYVHYKGL